MTRLAKTVEDVRRLAPVAGRYWTRASSSTPGMTHEWDVSRLETESGERWWYFEQDDFFDDQALILHEIVGPIPEPPDDE